MGLHFCPTPLHAVPDMIQSIGPAPRMDMGKEETLQTTKFTTAMKKIILLLAAATLSFTNASAQDEAPKNEVGIYYGFGSLSNVVSIFGEAFTFSTGSQTGFWGPVGVEYYRHLTPLVAVGGMASVAGCKWDKTFGTDDELKTLYISIMPSVKLNWLRKNSFGLYSSASAGVMISTIKATDDLKAADSEVKNETATDFVFHVTALGAEFGKKFRAFGEIGFGERGVLCLGCRYRF